MKFVLLAGAALAMLAVVLSALLVDRTTTSAASPAIEPTDGSEEARALREQLSELTRRLEALERAQTAERLAPRTPAVSQHAAQPLGIDSVERDARWYLDRYVESFDSGDSGSDFFRLAVAAHVIELVDPICALLREGWRPQALRLGLIPMLGRQRLRAHLGVLDTLITLANETSPCQVPLAALDALAAIGNDRVGGALEELIALTKELEVRGKALEVLALLANDRWNEHLLGIFDRSSDATLRRDLPPWLDEQGEEAALALIAHASSDAVAVRLAAAQTLPRFPFDEFRSLARRWSVAEVDARVVALLRAFLDTESAFPGWHAMNATGAPDADLRRDDVKAWASVEADGGIEWLELDYPTPTRALGVRIFEACSAGAVDEVLAKLPNGSWSSLWKGEAPSTLGEPLVLRWATTSSQVRTIRVVFDTRRTEGWNEIDAVELLGPGGGQWARRARASSTYGSNRAQPSRVESVRSR